MHLIKYDQSSEVNQIALNARKNDLVIGLNSKIQSNHSLVIVYWRCRDESFTKQW